MVAINFQYDFVIPIRQKIKRQTIRANARCKPGDKLQLYTGMRTKQCEKILDAVCTSIIPVKIGARSIIINDILFYEPEVLKEFAARDGFTSWLQCKTFFKTKYGLPFKGYLITWE